MQKIYRESHHGNLIHPVEPLLLRRKYPSHQDNTPVQPNRSHTTDLETRWMFWKEEEEHTVKSVLIEHRSQGWMLPATRQSLPPNSFCVCNKHALSLNCVPPDVNDNVPFFTSSIYEASVTEGAEAGTLVFQVSANDLDLGLNGKVKRKS